MMLNKLSFESENLVVDYISTQDQRVTGLELELFSLVKMLVTFINFSKLENLI